VSSRLKEFGRQVLIGDLVIRKDQAHLIDNIVEDESIDLEEEGVAEAEEEVKQQKNPKDIVIEVTA